MIDYDKLKIADSLLQKYCKDGKEVKIEYCLQYSGNCLDQWYTINDETIDHDDLIEKLQFLTEPVAKYKDAWYLNREKIISCTVVHAGDHYVCCDETNPEAVGCTMYPTKAELIEAQIEYWLSLKDENYRENGLSSPRDICSHDGYINCRCCNNSWTTGFRVIQKELIDDRDEFVTEKSCDNNVTEEYCEHSGVKLGKEPLDKWTIEDWHEDRCPRAWVGKEKCMHQSDGQNYDNKTNEIRTGFGDFVFSVHLKCSICGERYGYDECKHECDGNFYMNEKIHNAVPSGLSLNELMDKGLRKKCIHCGEFYR